MTPEEREEQQKNIANGVYRGNFHSKNGWDPGDPDEVELWFVLLILGAFVFFGIANIYSYLSR
tara:strand:+ start:1883 stop:2071 length:189 start_codon:yes stop_codon:yes gene_type:complete